MASEVQRSTQIVLHEVVGIVRLSGVSPDGSVWSQFEIDSFADQDQGHCAICGATLDEGWQCLDGGEEVCGDHITIASRLD